MIFVSLASVVSDGVDVGTIVRDALRDCDMQHKEAWIVCGIDGAQWGRSLSGQAPLDLWKLRHLPARFWREFLPCFGKALILHAFDTTMSDFRMARANVQAHDDKKEKAG